MSEAKREEYIVRGSVRERGKPAARTLVVAEIVDVDLNPLGADFPPLRGLGVIAGVRTAEDGSFEIPIPSKVIQIIGRGDKRAQIVLQALSGQGKLGTAFIDISSDSPPDQVTIKLESQGGAAKLGGGSRADGEALEVQFSTEVLDAILGMTGGASGAGTPVTAGAFDDRFFEERLRRLIGANVRAGDIAGLRREIDRVVVEEEIEGEKQFVFRGAGRPRVAKMTASAAYTTTGSPASGSMKLDAMGSSYTSANSTASVPAGSANGGSASPSGGDNLAGPQAILYRRAVAEFDQVRQALASLRPENPEDSQEFEAFRSLVDDGLVDLVTALGSELGPTALRIDGTFEDLLGADSTQLGGYLKRLAELGKYPIDQPALDRAAQDSFLTLDEEQEQTRFLELKTYVTGLRNDWNEFRQRIVEPTTLNVRSTILVRRIGFAADAVRELDLALATAPGDPSERQFAPIDNNGTTLDEYITWLNDFVADGQSQLRDGNTASFDAIGREAGRLAEVATAALNSQVVVLKRRLVRRALEELRDNLQAIAPPNPDGVQGAGGSGQPRLGTR